MNEHLDQIGKALGKASNTESQDTTITNESRGAQVIQVDAFGRYGIVMLWLTTFVAAFALVIGVMAWYHSTLAERETRVFNDNVLRLGARLEASGVLEQEGEH